MDGGSCDILQTLRKHSNADTEEDHDKIIVYIR
jgi:hypothetical protein